MSMLPPTSSFIAALYTFFSNIQQSSPRPILLSPHMGDGDITAQLAQSLCMIPFGAEADHTLYRKASRRIHISELGTPGSLRITRHCASLLFLTPGTYSVIGTLEHVQGALKSGAPLVFHLTPQQCTHALAKWLSQNAVTIRTYRVPNPLGLPTVLCLASYQTYDVPDQVIAQIHRELQDPPSFLAPSDIQYYRIPAAHGDRVEFYSTSMDLNELATGMDAGAWLLPDVCKAINPPPQRVPKPLLPTKPGHLALHIAAGCLNGREVTYRGHRVLIKGQTVKRIATIEDEELDAQGQPTPVIRSQESFTTSIKAIDLSTGLLIKIEDRSSEGAS